MDADGGVAAPPESAVTASAPTDPELVRLAADGVAAAFALLLRRHADVLVPIAREPGGERRLRVVGVRAMRALHRSPPTDDVRGWLAGIAGVSPVPAPTPRRERSGLGRRDWVDALWVDLAARWPNGRRRLTVPRWARALTAAVVIVAAGVVAATAMLRERPPAPLVGQVQAYARPSTGDDFVVEDEDELGELPVFELPPDDEPAPAPPTAPITPEPEPEEPAVPGDTTGSAAEGSGTGGAGDGASGGSD